MHLLSPMEKSQSTLYSTSTISVNNNSSSTNSGDYDRTNNINNVNNNDINNINTNSISDDSDSDLSLNECDVTFVDDDDINCTPKNEAEMMFYQVVEMLRFEQEVC